MIKEKKSLQLNMLLNSIKNLMTIVFPLLSFPYVSRVLGVESLGRYNFAASVITYIALLAGLGVESYAIREGAKVRDDREKINDLANQVFSINMVSTLLAYLILAILIIVVPKFQNDTVLLLVLSTQVIFVTVGVNWIYSIYEDFAYITLRSIIFQFLSLIFMFVFINDANDVLIYACITVFASAGSNLINLFLVRKYCKIRFIFNIDWKKHLKPILIFFVMAASVTIYSSSDTVIIGFISGDFAVGIYSVSHKVYSIVKNLLFSAIMVSIPRISMLIGKKQWSDVENVAKSILFTTISLVVPAIVGLITLSKEFILLISDETYLSATTSFVLLSISIIFCMGGYFWGHAILIPLKEEGFVLKITIISAIVNVLLNLILVPFFDEVAAALTTMIAEALVFVLSYFKAKRYVQIKGTIRMILKCLVGALPIIPIAFCVRIFTANLIIISGLTMIFSVMAYIIISILLKNESIIPIFRFLGKHIKKS